MKRSKYSFKDRIIAISIVLVVFGLFAFWFYSEIGKANLPNGDKIVYITRTGSKYHYASCSYLHSSSIDILLVEAINRGYGSCSRCDPPEYISEEEYGARKDSRSPIVMVLLSLLITGFLWGILYGLIKEFSGDWFIYILFAIAYGIVLKTIYKWF